MPQNVDKEVERSVLQRAILDPDWAADAGLTPEMFAISAHRAVHAALCSVLSAGGGVDSVTVGAALRTASGDESWLDTVMDGQLSYEPSLVTRLRDLAECRRLADNYRLGTAAADAGDLPGARAALPALLEHPGAAAGGKPMGGREQMEDFAHFLQEGNDGIDPGCPIVRKLVGYLQPGMVYVIAADNNVGKSSVMLEMAEQMGAAGVRSGTISMEDAPRLFSARRIQRRTGVSARRIFHKTVDHEQMALVIKAMGEIAADDRVDFRWLRGGTCAEVVLAMTQLVRRGARALFMDYLQAIKLEVAAADRRNEIRLIFCALCSTAVRLNIPIIVGSQLVRSEEKQGKKPSKHRLKESGDVADGADVILMLWREKESDAAPVKIYAAKTKYGGLGAEDEYVRDRKTGALRPAAPGDVQEPEESAETWHDRYY